MTDKTEALDRLRDMLTPGTTVYTDVEHVSRSGMSRRISAYIVKDGSIVDITWLIARAGVAKLHREGGVTMGGCGMDMGFALIYNLGCALYPEGFPCTGSTGYTKTYRKTKHPRCMSDEHVNAPVAPHRKGLMHKGRGGYALNQSWL